MAAFLSSAAPGFPTLRALFSLCPAVAGTSRRIPSGAQPRNCYWNVVSNMERGRLRKPPASRPPDVTMSPEVSQMSIPGGFDPDRARSEAPQYSRLRFERTIDDISSDAAGRRGGRVEPRACGRGGDRADAAGEAPSSRGSGRATSAGSATAAHWTNKSRPCVARAAMGEILRQRAKLWPGRLCHDARLLDLGRSAAND